MKKSGHQPGNQPRNRIINLYQSIVYCNPVPIEGTQGAREHGSMKCRAPSFPRSLRKGWDRTRRPAPSIPLVLQLELRISEGAGAFRPLKTGQKETAFRPGLYRPAKYNCSTSPESLVFYSLLPTPYFLSQSTFPTLTRLTLGVSPPYPRKSGFTSIFIRLHTLVFVRHSAARSLQTVFEIAHRNPSRPFPAWQRLPAPSRAPSFRPF